MMLAQRAQPDDIERLQRQGYLFDLKIDGVRCRAEVTDDGAVTLRSRVGTEMSDRYPDVVAALREVAPAGGMVLDGEIAVNDDRGLPSWPLTHKRDAQRSLAKRYAETMPATYYAFDVLRWGHVATESWAYANRRQVLDVELDSGPVKPVLHSADGEALWEVVSAHKMEGIVAKRADGRYRSGRTRDWLKIKRTSSVTCLVGGVDPGEGFRASTFGALHLYLLDNDRDLVQVGKVGSGFSDLELKRVSRLLHEPPLVVEVEYLDVSPDGLLRQPVFTRVRHDVGLDQCTLSQLV